MKPYVYFLLTALSLYLGTLGIFTLGWIAEMPTYSLQTILFLFFVTVLIYRYISRFSSEGSAVETQFYLASIAMKLLTGCAFIVVVMMMDKMHAVANAVLFLISYIIFTAIEIGQLMAAKKG